ncbi:Putative membrane protein (fragment) [Clostridioides difficile]|uniref:Putative membrane protein n=1 Tax=Clostridioides difficile TaxID=1496 RepID=A0A069AQV8_CLODI
MVDTLEFGLKILFFILSIIWMGKIMILRTDKQIVINPLLIGISAVLVMLHTSQSNIEFFWIRCPIYKNSFVYNIFTDNFNRNMGY